jgi:hypothetical protein
MARKRKVNFDFYLSGNSNLSIRDDFNQYMSCFEILLREKLQPLLKVETKLRLFWIYFKGFATNFTEKHGHYLPLNKYPFFQNMVVFHINDEVSIWETFSDIQKKEFLKNKWLLLFSCLTPDLWNVNLETIIELVEDAHLQFIDMKIK